MKRILAIALLITLALGGAWYWHNHKEAAPEAAGGKNRGPQAVVTAAPSKRDLAVIIDAVGSLIASEEASIHAEVSGQIKEVQFQEGQPVKKGDMLIKIDSSLAETDLLQAKAAMEAKKAAFSRDDKLKSSGFVADQQYDTSRAELQGAEAAVANAEILITKSSIRAPFDGVAGLRNFSAGDYAAVGQALTTVVAIDPLKLEFSVPEKNYAAIKTGQKISFAVDAFTGENFSGEIYAIDPQINPENRNFTVKANIPNTDGKLRPGMYARIRIETATRPGALMAPEEAIIPEGKDSYVFVVNGGKAQRKKVTLGERQSGAVEIKDGITADDRLIVAGVMKLRDGAAVNEQAAEQPAVK